MSEPSNIAGGAGQDAQPVPPQANKDPDQRNSENGDSMKALTQLHTDFESLRHTLTCKICEKLFYEPFVLSCGHTYCYRCLSTWFSSTRKPSCPNCRVRIVQLPAPSYVIKELVAIFVARVELLPDGETVEDHETWKKEEAEFMVSERDNKDTKKGGLFRGKFRDKRKAGALRPVVDSTDNVTRCPNCNWELEDDECGQCGLTFDSEGNELSGSDDDDDGEEGGQDSYLDDIDDVDGDMGLEDTDAVWYEGEMSPGSVDEYGSDSPSEHHFSSSHDARHQMNHAAALRANGQPPFGQHGPQWIGYRSGGGHYADEDDEEDDEDDEDDSEGSMDGFIVDDSINDTNPITIESDSASAAEPSVPSRMTWRHRSGAQRRVVLDDDEDDEDSDQDSSGSGSGSDDGSQDGESSSSSSSSDEGGDHADEEGGDEDDQDDDDSGSGSEDQDDDDDSGDSTGTEETW